MIQIAFNVFRQKDGARVKLNATPITQTTDFLDTNGFDAAVSYVVEPADGFKGASQAVSPIALQGRPDAVRAYPAGCDERDRARKSAWAILTVTASLIM